MNILKYFSRTAGTEAEASPSCMEQATEAEASPSPMEQATEAEASLPVITSDANEPLNQYEEEKVE